MIGIYLFVYILCFLQRLGVAAAALVLLGLEVTPLGLYLAVLFQFGVALCVFKA